MIKLIKLPNKRKLVPLIVPENKKAALEEIYKNYKFNGRDSFFREVRKKYAITREDCFNFLKKQETYQLHVMQKKESTIKPLFVKAINQLWQFDLIITENLTSPQNNWTFCVLTCIDVFSRYVYAKCLTNKTAEGIRKALEEFFKQNKVLPRAVQCDNSKEFKALNPFLTELGIKQIFSETYLPQQNSYVERFNRTLKQMIYLHMTKNNTKTYSKFVPEFIESYNNTYHNSIKNTPATIHDVKRENIKQIEINIKKKNEFLKGEYKVLKVGDKVRVHILTRPEDRKKEKFAKKYVAQWSTEVYKIDKVIKGEQTRPVYEVNGKRYHRDNLQKIF